MLKHNWNKIGIDSILTKTNSEGVRYLQLFLKDYVTLFGGVVNAGCNKCIAKYYNNYINQLSDMENDCKYRLHKKREGLPLAFGSNIRVTNRNITDAYAKQLIERYQSLKAEFKLADLFSTFPVEPIKEPTPVKEIEVKEPQKVSKPRKKRKSKS